MNNRLLLSMAAATLGILPIACGDSSSSAEGSAEASSYAVGFRVMNNDATTADYVLTIPSLDTGVISVENQGIEQTGWRYMGAFGNILYSVGYYNDNNFISYAADESGVLRETGRFAFENTLDLFGDIDATTLLAMEVPRVAFTPRVFHVIDMSKTAIAKKLTDSIYVNHADSLVAWPTAMTYRDGKVFIPFYQLHARGDFSTPSTDTAFIAVYSWPDLKQEKVIKDNRMGPIGVYGARNGSVLTSSGDLYAFSSGAKAAGFTTQQKHSGILRVAKGSTEFDASYFWDVEEATGGKKVVWMAPIAGEKVLMRLVTDDSVIWGAYGNELICQLAIADLSAKTIEVISDIPLHRGGYVGYTHIENGKAYMSINTGSEASLWAIDVNTGKASRGAKIAGYEIPMIVDLR